MDAAHSQFQHRPYRPWEDDAPDRFLTRTVADRDMAAQLLDSMDLE